MKSTKSKSPGKIFFTLLSIMIIFTGVCYILAACHIYFTGGQHPYSREVVGEHLLWLLLPSLLTVIMTVVGFFTSLFDKVDVPVEEEPSANEVVSPMPKLKKLLSKFDEGSSSDEVKLRLKEQRGKRSLALWVAILASVVSLIASSFILLDFERFTVKNINLDIAFASLIIFLAVALAGFAWGIYDRINAKATSEEISTIRSAIKESPALLVNSKGTEKKGFSEIIFSDTAKAVLRVAFFSLSVILIILGVLNGGMADVLGKAVNICTECIGLG